MSSSFPFCQLRSVCFDNSRSGLWGIDVIDNVTENTPLSIVNGCLQIHIEGVVGGGSCTEIVD